MKSFKEYLIEVEAVTEPKTSKAILNYKDAMNAATKFVSNLDQAKIPQILTNIESSRFDSVSKEEKEAALAFYIIANRVKSGTNPKPTEETTKIYNDNKLDSIDTHKLFSKINKEGPQEFSKIYKAIGGNEAAANNEATAAGATPVPAESATPAADVTPKVDGKGDPIPTPKDGESTEPEAEPEADTDAEVEADTEATPEGRNAGSTPSEIAANIEKMADDESASLSKNGNKAGLKFSNKLMAALTGYAKVARSQQSRFDVHPTPASKQKAMSNSQIAYNNAKRDITIFNNKYQNKMLGSTVGNTAKAALGALKNAKDYVKDKIDNSRAIQMTADKVRQGAQNATKAVTSGINKGKEGIQRGVQGIMDRSWAKNHPGEPYPEETEAAKAKKDALDVAARTSSGTMGKSEEELAAAKAEEAKRNALKTGIAVAPTASPASPEILATKNRLKAKIKTPAEIAYKANQSQQRSDDELVNSRAKSVQLPVTPETTNIEKPVAPTVKPKVSSPALRTIAEKPMAAAQEEPKVEIKKAVKAKTVSAKEAAGTKTNQQTFGGDFDEKSTSKMDQGARQAAAKLGAATKDANKRAKENEEAKKAQKKPVQQELNLNNALQPTEAKAPEVVKQEPALTTVQNAVKNNVEPASETAAEVKPKKVRAVRAKKETDVAETPKRELTPGTLTKKDGTVIPVRKPKAEVTPEAAEPVAKEAKAPRVLSQTPAAIKLREKMAATKAAKAEEDKNQPELPLEGGKGKKPPKTEAEKEAAKDAKLRKEAAEAAGPSVKTRQGTLYPGGKYASVDTGDEFLIPFHKNETKIKQVSKNIRDRIKNRSKGVR